MELPRSTYYGAASRRADDPKIIADHHGGLATSSRLMAIAWLACSPTPSAVSEHSSELIGCPISRSLTTSCVRLELRSLPSTC
jgi:hypothetical protein